MPKVPTYDAPALDLHPSETGIDALGQAARRVGAFYGQAAEDYSGLGNRIGSATREALTVALQAEEHRETTAGAKNFATLVANKTDEWNKIAATADPNDPTLKQRFLDKLEPDLEKFAGDGFITENGRKFAQAHVAQFRQHMFEKTTADMSRLAGEAAHANTRETENKLSNNAYNDPSALDFTLKTWEASINGIVGSSPNLGANAGPVRTTLLEHGREAIVKSAAIGYITRTGQVPDWVNDPKYSKYVNGAELKQFQRAAEAQTKANDFHDRQAQVLQKQQADLAVHKDATELLAKGVAVDPNNPSRLLISPDFMKNALDIARRNPDAPSAAATVRTMLDWAEHQNHQRAEPVTSDQTVMADLMARLGDPNNPTSEMQVLDWAARDKLSPHHTQLLREMVKTVGPQAMHEPLVHAALQGASERAGVGLMADGHERYSNFLQAFWPEYLRQKNAGTLKPNALDFKDETSLIRQTIKAYEPTTQERLRAAVMKRMQTVGDVPQPEATVPLSLQPGAVVKGYKFKGGNPALDTSWEKVK